MTSPTVHLARLRAALETATTVEVDGASPALEVTLDVDALGPPPVGAPVDFRERLVRALKTVDAAVLRDAEAAYRGVYESEHAYIVSQVAEHLQPPDLTWLLACCDPDRLREGYEGRALVVWSIALEHGGCMVFESLREPPEVLGALLGVELDEHHE